MFEALTIEGGVGVVVFEALTIEGGVEVVRGVLGVWCLTPLSTIFLVTYIRCSMKALQVLTDSCLKSNEQLFP